MTGTALTEARAAANARRGFVGTTTVKSAVHTATQESPVQLPFTASDDGSNGHSEAEPPKDKIIPMRRGRRAFRRYRRAL